MNRKNILIAVTIMLGFVACGEKAKQETTTPPTAAVTLPSAATPSAPATPGTGLEVARLNGDAITIDDLRKIGGTKFAQAESEFYDAQKNVIDQIVDDRLLDAEAKKQNVAKEELLKKNVADKVKVDDKEIEKFFNEKKEQMQGKKLDDVKANIRNFLSRDKQQNLYGDYLGGLRKKAHVEIAIHVPKVEIEEGDNPAIGPKDAPVKIVEFTDYQCPFCGRARPTVNQILDEYKGKVRYVLRDFPLSFHKDSIKAHEGARCAGEQGKYWEMNKKLFANQQAIKVEDIKKYADELKLNKDKFNQCLDSDKYVDVVKKNQQYGETVGVSGTPAFFINGRMISGARPFNAFKDIIDSELKDAKN